MSNNDNFNLKSFSLNEKIDFFTELYTYIKSSIPISTALTKIMKYSQSSKVKELASLMLKTLDSGEDFSVSVLRFKSALGSVYCNLMAIGAQAGELPKITQDILNSLKKQRSAIRNIIKACSYPAVLLLMLFVAVLLLLFFIAPRIATMAEMLSGNIPPLINTLVFMGAFLSKNWIIFIALIVYFVWVTIQFLKKFFTSQGAITIPLLGRLIRLYNLSVFSKIFAISYSAGVPVTSGLLLSAEAVSNNYIKNKLFKCSPILTKKTLSETFEQTGLFDPQMIAKIESGEMTGNIDVILNEISSDIDEMLETFISFVLKLIEPILIIIMGILICIYGSIVMGATNPFSYM